MSLDVYLIGTEKRKSESSGIFVREGGQTIEISEEEWKQRNPNQTPVKFESIDEKAKKYASLEVSDSRWPLLKLLAQANRAGLSYRWSVSLLDNPNEKLNAGFAFRRDPFEFFSAIKNR